MAHRAFHSKKRLGQNFLYDPAIAQKIIRSADLAPGQIVVELGAGKGILTRPLAKLGVRLIAIELDAELHRGLEMALGGGEHGQSPQAGTVELLNADFTRISLTGLLASRGLQRCVLIGNIPYHLTREVLFSFLVDECEMVEAAYLMVQREVGDRIVSKPGGRVYGITSVILQSLYGIRTLFKVMPGSFHPRPKVASAVLEFRPLSEPVVGWSELKDFRALVKNLFQQRRKTIHNTMRAFYSLGESELREIESRAGIDLGRRPEALSNEEFLRLSRAVVEATSVG